jgi:hypothetical protein
VAKPPVETLSWRQLNRATLQRQLLLARERRSALSVIHDLLGLQAQWPRSPAIALWSRLESFAREELLDLFRERTAVRATLMRGTLHVVTAPDYLALRPTLTPVLDRALEGPLRGRLDGIDLAALVLQARGFLGKQTRTFEQIREHLARLNPKGDERALGYAVRMRLALVQAPDAERWGFATQPLFADAEAWLGKRAAKPLSVAELVKRYLAAYGPASVVDMQAWTGLQRLNDVVTAMAPELRLFADPRGRLLFDLPAAPRPDPDLAAPVRLLPEFDSMIVARADERFVAAQHRPKVFLSALRIAPTFLVDGFAAGTWKLERKRTVATLTLQPFGPLAKKARTALMAEASALLRFTDPDAEKSSVLVG